MRLPFRLNAPTVRHEKQPSPPGQGIVSGSLYVVELAGSTAPRPVAGGPRPADARLLQKSINEIGPES
jgi:hypothetical protein